jgi:hypothetical protein
MEKGVPYLEKGKRDLSDIYKKKSTTEPPATVGAKGGE